MSYCEHVVLIGPYVSTLKVRMYGGIGTARSGVGATCLIMICEYTHLVIHLGPRAVAAVEAVVVRCGQRHAMLQAEYAPVSAAARAAAMDAAPSLKTARDAFVQAHEVVMMHEARPQVAGGKNAQIEVRVAKLRAEWKGSPEELDIMRDVGIQGHISARASIRITSTCSWEQPGYNFPHLDPSPLSPSATFACRTPPQRPKGRRTKLDNRVP